jgi:hypothetical protein
LARDVTSGPTRIVREETLLASFTSATIRRVGAREQVPRAGGGSRGRVTVTVPLSDAFAARAGTARLPSSTSPASSVAFAER